MCPPACDHSFNRLAAPKTTKTPYIASVLSPVFHPLLFHVSQHYRLNLVPFRPSVDTQNGDDTTYRTHFIDPFPFVRTTFRVQDGPSDALLTPKIVKTRHIEHVLLRPSRPFVRFSNAKQQDRSALFYHPCNSRNDKDTIYRGRFVACFLLAYVHSDAAHHSSTMKTPLFYPPSFLSSRTPTPP